MKNFKEWNEKMYEKYGNEDRYFSKNILINFNTNSRLKSITKNIKDGGHVLELGCGAGIILKNINNYKSLTGVDISKKAVEDANKNLSLKKNITLLNGDVQEINLNKKFDTIICAEVLEHLPKPEKVINTIVTHAKDDSLIIITIPNEKNIDFADKLLKLFLRKKFSMDWHIHKFDLALLRKITKDKLKIKKVIKTPFFIFPISYTVICKLDK